MSVHLRTTGKLGQQHAAEINHLQRSMEVQENALETVRQELAQIQASKAAADHQHHIYARQSSETIRFCPLYIDPFCFLFRCLTEVQTGIYSTKYDATKKMEALAYRSWRRQSKSSAVRAISTSVLPASRQKSRH